MFFVCGPCDRGQCYCSEACAKTGRRKSVREAGRRHQQSPEGKLDHTDRQRKYRKRCQEKISLVTHQGSHSEEDNLQTALPPKVSVQKVIYDKKNVFDQGNSLPQETLTALSEHSGPVHESRAEGICPQCAFCGEKGTYVRHGANTRSRGRSKLGSSRSHFK